MSLGKYWWIFRNVLAPLVGIGWKAFQEHQKGPLCPPNAECIICPWLRAKQNRRSSN